MSAALAIIGGGLVLVALLGCAGLAVIIWVMCRVVKGILLPPENR